MVKAGMKWSDVFLNSMAGVCGHWIRMDWTGVVWNTGIRKGMMKTRIAAPGAGKAPGYLRQAQGVPGGGQAGQQFTQGPPTEWVAVSVVSVIRVLLLWVPVVEKYKRLGSWVVSVVAEVVWQMMILYIFTLVLNVFLLEVIVAVLSMVDVTDVVFFLLWVVLGVVVLVVVLIAVFLSVEALVLLVTLSIAQGLLTKVMKRTEEVVEGCMRKK